MKYKRVLLKLSGESLAGDNAFGLDATRLGQYALEISQARMAGVQVAVVIGGGNIFRGMKGSLQGFDRQTGDYMGMLATLINGMALQSALEAIQVRAVLMSGIDMPKIAEIANGQRAIRHLDEGRVVIFGGGTGNPFFTTDTAAALRAVEIHADALLKGTRVDGIYSDDPEKNPAATRYDRITFREAYDKGLKIMDLTAYTLCSENNIPLVVFDMNRHGNLAAVLRGEPAGTVVDNK